MGRGEWARSGGVAVGDTHTRWNEMNVVSAHLARTVNIP